MIFKLQGVRQVYEFEGKLVANTSRKLTIGQYIDLMRRTNGYLQIDDGDAGERGTAGLQTMAARDLILVTDGGKVIWSAK